MEYTRLIKSRILGRQTIIYFIKIIKYTTLKERGGSAAFVLVPALRKCKLHFPVPVTIANFGPLTISHHWKPTFTVTSINLQYPMRNPTDNR